MTLKIYVIILGAKGVVDMRPDCGPIGHPTKMGTFTDRGLRASAGLSQLTPWPHGPGPQNTCILHMGRLGNE